MQSGVEGGPPFDCAVAAMRELFDARYWQWSDEAPLEVPHPSGFTELVYVISRR
jgi:hypothetical protein